MTCRYPNNCRKRPNPRAKLCRGCAHSKRMNRPEEKAKFTERMAEANYRKHWSWCPPEYRDAYEKMRDGAWTAAEAKAEVLSWKRETA